MTRELSRRRVLIFLILIVAVAIFFRFWELAETPPALWPDEAVNGIDALTALETGEYRPYYPANNGREGLFINLQALSLALFGAQSWALRLVSGIFGVLAVIGVFLFARRVWGARVALVSSYLMAIGFWAVNFSRIGFRAIMLPAILIWCLWLLVKGTQERRAWLLFAAGLVYGIGLHSYISFRVTPLLLITLLVILGVRGTHSWKKLGRYAAIFAVGAIITASPLLLYYANNPGDFMGRASQVSIFAYEKPIRALGVSTLQSLGMFAFEGDGNWRHNVAGRPLTGDWMRIFFIVGLVYVLYRIVHRKEKFVWDIFLLAWMVVLLIPNFLAPEGSPHALRALGTQPAAYILTAIGLVWVYNRIQQWLGQKQTQREDQTRRIGRIQREIAVLAILILVFVGVKDFRLYFLDWALAPEVAAAFEEGLAHKARFLERRSSDEAIYLIDNSGGVAIASLRFYLWDIRERITILSPSDLPEFSALEASTIMIVRADQALLSELSRRYPEARVWNSYDALTLR